PDAWLWVLGRGLRRLGVGGAPVGAAWVDPDVVAVSTTSAGGERLWLCRRSDAACAPTPVRGRQVRITG
ncbi:MAG: hypothetical protein HOQ45_05340, partial [Nocardioidaceae bacterium]|nr:hypothetical protein [Nocardioidaceae bacterium]